VVRAATRGSALALWQTHHVGGLIAAVDSSIDVPEVVVSTAGDRNTDVPIHTMGGKGVFVKEVQAAVLDGRADIAVHSAKDLPAQTPEGLVIGAFAERADPRDVLVGAPLEALGQGAVVATGSVRRRAQLAAHEPGLEFVELRGNIATRLEKAAGFDAIVMAKAALDRLGIERADVYPLSVDEMVPQVGQGALAVECRRDDTFVRDLLAGIDHQLARQTLTVERAFLDELGGDCDLPAGAHARIHGDGLEVDGILADGGSLVRRCLRGRHGRSLGRSLAQQLRDDLLRVLDR
jgi:hydroxymethylbilane synthase